MIIRGCGREEAILPAKQEEMLSTQQESCCQSQGRYRELRRSFYARAAQPKSNEDCEGSILKLDYGTGIEWAADR